MGVLRYPSWDWARLFFVDDFAFDWLVFVFFRLLGFAVSLFVVLTLVRVVRFFGGCFVELGADRHDGVG